MKELDVYLYNATIIDVYDGDSCTIMLDIGFHLFLEEDARLYGIDTPELRTKNLEEKKAGYKARDYLRKRILNKDVKVRTYKEGKFGRYLIDIFLLEGDEYTNINKELIEKGYAKPYLGGTKEKFSKMT